MALPNASHMLMLMALAEPILQVGLADVQACFQGIPATTVQAMFQSMQEEGLLAPSDVGDVFIIVCAPADSSGAKVCALGLTLPILLCHTHGYTHTHSHSHRERGGLRFVRVAARSCPS